MWEWAPIRSSLVSSRTEVEEASCVSFMSLILAIVFCCALIGGNWEGKREEGSSKNVNFS